MWRDVWGTAVTVYTKDASFGTRRVQKSNKYSANTF